MQTNPAVEQSKIITWSESPCNQSGGKGKGLWRKGFAEEPSSSGDPPTLEYYNGVGTVSIHEVYFSATKKSD